jgi:hypothetical protein
MPVVLNEIQPLYPLIHTTRSRDTTRQEIALFHFHNNE